MTKIIETCIEPYIDSFMRCFAEANYKPATIKARGGLAKLNSVMSGFSA